MHEKKVRKDYKLKILPTELLKSGNDLTEHDSEKEIFSMMVFSTPG
jgi:hypothetical protein